MGKAEFLSRIFCSQERRALLIALDDSSISGPENNLRDMERAVTEAVDGGANAVLGFVGLFKRYSAQLHGLPGFMNITLSTAGPEHLHKVLVGTVEQAKRLNLGVSVHLNITAPTEPQMLQILGQTAVACDQLDVALLAHVYPRRFLNGKEDHYQDLKRVDSEAYAQLVRHGARIAADLGADIVKVPFTGSAETFATVTESTYGLPVLMAAGPKIPLPDILEQADLAMASGAKGVAMGRNFFQRDKARQTVQAFRAVVHDRLTAEQALAQVNLSPLD